MQPNIPSRSPRHPLPRAARKFPNTRLPVPGGCAQFASPCIARTTTRAAPFFPQAACAGCPAPEVSQLDLVPVHSPTHIAPAAHTNGNGSEGLPEGNPRPSSLPHSNSSSDETRSAEVRQLAVQRPRARHACNNLRLISAADNPHRGESFRSPSLLLLNSHATTASHTAHKIWDGVSSVWCS